MNNKKKICNLLVVGCLLLTLLAVVFTGGCPAKEEPPPPPPPTDGEEPPPPPPKHLTVGAIMPLSGPISTVGMAWVRGFELYFDKVNEEGGVKIGDERYLIDFIAEDSKANPEAAATAAKKLVFQDGATFVFGAILEPCTQAIYDICAPNGVLHLITWVNIAWHPADVSPDKPLCVRPMISPHDSNIPDIDYLVEAYPDAKTMAISAPNLGYETMIEQCTSVAAERGVEVVVTEIWEFGIIDFIPLYTLLLASEPDVIFAMVSAQASYQLLAARQLGFTGPFISSSPLGPDVFLAVAGPEACTDVICSGWDPATATGVLKEIVDRWQAKYGAEPFISDASFAWDEGWILVQAMEKAQSVDPEEVLAALDTMTEPGSLQTGFGPAHMGGLESFGVNRVLVRPIPISHIMNGEIEFVGFMPIEVK